MNFLFLIVISILFSSASSAPPSPTCALKGKVEKIETRKTMVDNSSVRPTEKNYEDVTIKVSTIDGPCNQLMGSKVFQLRDKNERPTIGKCIAAKTQYSGDEFALGQWVFEIKNIADKDCK